MAKKPSISNITSGYTSTTTLNANFEALRDGFDNTLSLDGSTPNAMGADLDMNSNDILNANIVDTNALKISGTLVGVGDLSAAGATLSSVSYTGNGSTVAFSTVYEAYIKDNTQVYIDGVYQNKDGYSISGTTLTFSEAPPLNSEIEIVVARTLDFGAEDAANVGYTQGGTGSVNRTVLSKLQETVSVKDFGAVGDGVTDDTASFLAFNTWATSLPSETMVVLEFERGAHYMVSDPRWPQNIPNLTVNGNGAVLQNNASAAAPFLNKQLLITSWGLQNVTSWPTPGNLVNNYRLDTTTVGSSSVTTSTAAEAGNFSAGETVLIASWNMQFSGFPPNFRYFEYKKVVSVDAGTGVITLDSPILYRHQSDFPYLSSDPYGEGRATILKLEQVSLWDIDHKYKDIVFEANATPVTFDCLYMTGKRIEMVNCTAPYFLPSVVGTCHLKNCTQTAENQVSTEIDKLITNVVLEDCVWKDKLNSASSVVNFKAIRSSFDGGYSLTSPVNVSFIDCNVSASSQSDVQLLNQYQTTDNFLISGGKHTYYPSFSILSAQTTTVAINGSTITWTPLTSTLFVNFGTDSARQTFANKLVPGALIFVTGTSAGEELPTGPTGIVRSVTGGDGTVSAVVDFNAALAGTERLTFYPEPKLTHMTGTDIDGVRDYVTFRHTEVSYRNLKLTGGLAFTNQVATGRPVELIIDVKRPYTGSTAGNVYMQFYDNFPTYTGFNYTVDLKTAGLRATSLYGFNGWTGTGGESAGAALTAGTYASELFGKYDLFSTAMTVADDDEYPIVDITLRLASPFNNLGR